MHDLGVRERLFQETIEMQKEIQQFAVKITEKGQAVNNLTNALEIKWIDLRIECNK
jgi:hypothetical protein